MVVGWWWLDGVGWMVGSAFWWWCSCKFYASVWVYLCGCVCVCVYQRRRRRWVWVFLIYLFRNKHKHNKGEEKKKAKREINKIIWYTFTVTVIYIYCYCNKCVNIHSFRRIDVEDFWDKMCKICCFLYFAKFYVHWCGCLGIFVDNVVWMVHINTLFAK